MHARTRAASLTETLGIRVTEDERRALEERADEAHLSLSEWCRQALLASVSTSPETRLVLSEVLALRRVFLALQVDLLQGRELTEDRIRAAMEEADRTKFEMAEKRISAFRDRGQKPKSQPNGEAVQ
jgi:hypothetical protein